jgi:hypothetical protein
MRFTSIAVVAFAAVAARADVVEDVQEVVSDVSSSASSAVESATSSAVSKPTFTVRFTSVALQIRPILTDLSIAHHTQGTIPRAIHRRLGVKMEVIKCQEAK